MTGKQGFQRNLTTDEIMTQIYSIPQREELTNIVFMGMGEPSDNLEAVSKAAEIITSSWGLAWSPKRVTISTVGIKKQLTTLLTNNKCHIAISLHATYPKRETLIPADRAFSAQEIINTLKEYDFSHQRRLSFEYIMFAGVNDTQEDADNLITLLKGIDCRVNLIKYHTIPSVTLKPSDEQTMIKFRDYLTQKGITTTIRSSRGEDILAACGMLSSQKK